MPPCTLIVGLFLLASVVSAENILPITIVGGVAVTDPQSIEAQHTVRIRVRSSFNVPRPGEPDGPVRFSGTKLCSGVLIGPRTVLTAAHCFPTHARPNGRWIPVVIDGYEVESDDGSIVPGVEYVRHPGFDDTALVPSNVREPIDDIALLQVSRQPPGKTPVEPVEVGAPDPEIAVVAGYGRETRLSTVDLIYRGKLWNRKDFWMGASDLNRTTAVSAPKGICDGDSGGPVFVPASSEKSARLLGVISRQTGDCDRSISIATDVRSYISWILVEWESLKIRHPIDPPG